MAFLAPVNHILVFYAMGTPTALIVDLGIDITEKKKNVSIEENQEEKNHFKCGSCGSKLNHNTTKHQASQKLEEETKCPVCGKTFRNGPKDLYMMHHLVAHEEPDNIKYGEKYKKNI